MLIDYARALANLGKVEEAIALLTSKLPELGNDSDIQYLLACLNCKIGNRDEAREWLSKAFSSDLGSFYKTTALEESDLEPLWMELRGTS